MPDSLIKRCLQPFLFSSYTAVHIQVYSLFSKEDYVRQVLEEMKALFEQNQRDV
jgi:hypothetical protein